MNQKLKTQIEKVSEWVVALDYSHIPSDVIRLAELQFLDTIAAICAGSISPVGIKIYKALSEYDPKGNCTIIPQNEKWDLNSAVYYHSALINALEMDNFSFMGHLSQSAVSTSLSIAEMLNLSWKEMLLAMIVAQEVSGRLGAYMVSGPHQGHMRSFIHRAGAAVATTKLYKCDKKITSQALAIALSMPEFPLLPASFSPETKIICTSSPTVEGIKAAMLAMNGFEGSLDIIEHPAGLVTYFSYMKNAPDFWGQIGKTWVMQTISFKKYAACAHAQSPIKSALEIYYNKEFSVENISNVKVYCPLLTIIMETFSTPHYGSSITAVNTHFSTRRSVAATLLCGPLTGEFYAKIFENKKNIIESLSNKIDLKHDWKQSINMLRGLDASLDGAGKPGLFNLKGTQHTLKKFRTKLKNRALIHFNDLPSLLSLSSEDLFYFIKRYLKSWNILLISKKQREEYRSYEKDLSKIEFRLSARVEVEMMNGQVFKAFCTIPDGFSGNPNRESEAIKKFFRETAPVIGEENSENIFNFIINKKENKIKDLFPYGKVASYNIEKT